ncbi:major facilitator superfamily protein [Cupriavidus basilensis OR16]|uniref:Major facilitator superfamily protein n=1 Tax=Cupriavidus basilensis OR16 TaxID=1127483 RepID=H1S2Z2_9BURK|nr:MFS transporter [Cupriavidus basilensis]EHP43207.1 major facilitator superfamily protein [Cupriavidus basilensis OR16]
MQEIPARAGGAVPPAETEAALPRLGREHLRVLGLSTLGGALEFYEFIIFIYLAPVLSAVMFPAEVPAWIRQLQTLGIFAAGYLIRPFGGILLSMLGDRVGRKRIFAVSLILMAAPTFAIGLLPGYAQVGVAAPLLLLLLRMCQGLAMGGELPIALTFIAEHVPTRRLGLATGSLGAAFTVGSLAGLLAVIGVSTAFPGAALQEFGWRLPFIAGGVFGFLSAYLRRYVSETPVFEEMRQRKQLSQAMPFRTLFRRYPVEVVLCLLASASTAGVLASAALYPMTYLQVELGFARAVVNQAQLWLLASMLAGTLAGGYLIDVLGWFKATGMFAAILLAGLLFTYVAPDPATLRYGFAIIGFGTGLTPMMYNLLVRSFTAPVRVTGIALTYNVAQALVGGLLPVLMASLAHFDRWAMIYVPAALGLLAAAIAPAAARYRKPIGFGAGPD